MRGGGGVRLTALTAGGTRGGAWVSGADVTLNINHPVLVEGALVLVR